MEINFLVRVSARKIFSVASKNFVVYATIVIGIWFSFSISGQFLLSEDNDARSLKLRNEVLINKFQTSSCFFTSKISDERRKVMKIPH